MKGDYGYKFYIIIEGNVKLIRLEQNSNNLKSRYEEWKSQKGGLMQLLNKEYKYNVICDLGVGQSFGEMSVLTSSSRQAVAYADSDVMVAVLSRKVFKQYMDEYYRDNFRKYSLQYYRECLVLQGLDDQIYNQLIFDSQIVVFQQNQIIYDYDDRLDYIYIVKTGELEVYLPITKDQHQKKNKKYSWMKVVSLQKVGIVGYEEQSIDQVMNYYQQMDMINQKGQESGVDMILQLQKQQSQIRRQQRVICSSRQSQLFRFSIRLFQELILMNNKYNSGIDRMIRSVNTRRQQWLEQQQRITMLNQIKKINDIKDKKILKGLNVPNQDFNSLFRQQIQQKKDYEQLNDFYDFTSHVQQMANHNQTLQSQLGQKHQLIKQQYIDDGDYESTRPRHRNHNEFNGITDFIQKYQTKKQEIPKLFIMNNIDDRYLDLKQSKKKNMNKVNNSLSQRCMKIRIDSSRVYQSMIMNQRSGLQSNVIKQSVVIPKQLNYYDNHSYLRELQYSQNDKNINDRLPICSNIDNKIIKQEHKVRCNQFYLKKLKRRLVNKQ